MYVMDPNGYYMFLDKFLKGDMSQIPVPIYIQCDYNLLKDRVKLRGDNMLVWEERYKSEDEQFTRFEKLLTHIAGVPIYIINNDNDFEHAIEKLKNIILNEMGS